MKKYFFKSFYYILGLFIIAIGVTFSVKSNLGVSPLNSIPYIISLILDIEQGIAVTFIFSLFILGQIIILRKEFKLYNLFQLIGASLFGYFVFITNSIFSFTPSENYTIRLVYLIFSIICIGIGISLYLKANFIPLPAEGIVLAIKHKTVFEFHKIKISFDFISVVIAILLSLIFLDKIQGVREGTILAVLFVGKVVGITNKITSKN